LFYKFQFQVYLCNVDTKSQPIMFSLFHNVTYIMKYIFSQ